MFPLTKVSLLNVIIFPLPCHLKKYVTTSSPLYSSSPLISPLFCPTLVFFSSLICTLLINTFSSLRTWKYTSWIHFQSKFQTPSFLVTAKMEKEKVVLLNLQFHYFLLFLNPLYNVSETTDCRLSAWTHSWIKISMDGASKSALTNPPGNSYKWLHLEKL